MADDLQSNLQSYILQLQQVKRYFFNTSMHDVVWI